MDLLYYRNLNLNSFYNEVDFNFSSEYSIKGIIKQIDVTSKHVEFSFEIEPSKIKSIFSEDSVISDASVIVGENGVGKSTLINEILFFGGSSHFSHSWQVLLSKKFLLIGENVKISEEEINKLKALFPDLEFINTNKNFYPKNLNYFVELQKKQSLFQYLSGKKLVLFIYSNSIEPTRIPNFSGKIYSTSEQLEEGVSLVDISTSNYLAQCNKWGLESILKETIFENNLLSLDNYQIGEFLNLYFRFPWFKNLFPKTITDKIEVRIHLGALPELFNRFIIDNNLFLNFDVSFPIYYRLIYDFKSDYITNVFREFLLAIILKLVDFYADPAVGIKDSINKILIDFENSVKDLFPVTKKEYSKDDMNNLILSYFKNSNELGKIDFAPIWKSFKRMMAFIMLNDRFSTQAFSVGFDEFTGLRLRLNEIESDLKLFFEIYSELITHSKFRLPFFKFSITNLSSGERNFVFLISRLMNHISMLEEVGDSPNNFTILLDEPGNDYHPEWQRTFFHNIKYTLEQYIKSQRKIKAQLIITTHSPLILSDFPENNIIKLVRKKLGNNEISTVNAPFSNGNSFGSNIYDLMNDSFFMANGFIGAFAQEKIDHVFSELTKKINNSEYNLKLSQENIKSIIDIIGEPLIQRQLSGLYDRVFKEDLEAEIINRQIDALKKLRDRKTNKSKK